MQHTLKKDITFNGIGLHSGKKVKMRLIPAGENEGIVFVRTDLDAGKNEIKALYSNVRDTRMCTVIANEHGASVGTIEHIMAALRGCGVDNLRIEIDRGEVPAMDGSSKLFVDAMDEAGYTVQTAPRRGIKILKTVTVTDGDKTVTLSPSDVPVYDGTIHFDHPSIGTQSYSLPLVNGNFRHDIADCRTFGFKSELAALEAAGLGQGVSYDNVIGLDETGVMNPDGLRCSDEFIRHKILDAVGDIALADGVVVGAYHAHKGGHALNNAILHAVFADRSAWMPVDLYGDFPENALSPTQRESGVRPLAMAH